MSVVVWALKSLVIVLWLLASSAGRADTPGGLFDVCATVRADDARPGLDLRVIYRGEAPIEVVNLIERSVQIKVSEHWEPEPPPERRIVTGPGINTTEVLKKDQELRVTLPLRRLFRVVTPGANKFEIEIKLALKAESPRFITLTKRVEVELTSEQVAVLMGTTTYAHKLQDTSGQLAPAELTATISVSGSVPEQDITITFLLGLTNDSDNEIRIIDPLEFTALQFKTFQNKPIDVPSRPSRFLTNNKNKSEWEALPYPAPIRLERIIQDGVSDSGKRRIITIEPHHTARLIFSCEKEAIDKLVAAMPSESASMNNAFQVMLMIGFGRMPSLRKVAYSDLLGSVSLFDAGFTLHHLLKFRVLAKE